MGRHILGTRHARPIAELGVTSSIITSVYSSPYSSHHLQPSIKLYQSDFTRRLMGYNVNTHGIIGSG